MGGSPDSIRVVTEADLLEVARVSRSTWQNWIKRNLIEARDNGQYGEEDVLELVVVSLLVDALDTRRARPVWDSSKVEVLAALATGRPEDDRVLDLVVDVRTLTATIATDATGLSAAIRTPVPFPRPRLVICAGELGQEARRGFWQRAIAPASLARDGRRKGSKRRRSA